MNTGITGGLAGNPLRERVGTARCGVRTLCSPSHMRMVDREVRCRLAKGWPTAGLPRFDPSIICLDGWQSGNAARWKPAEPARVRTFDPCTVRHIRARIPTGRRRHLEGVHSAGSNPAARINATVAQSVGGSGFKPRVVSVRIGPVAPNTRWRSPTAEAASLGLVQVLVQIGPPARVPFRSVGCNPVDRETEPRASRGPIPRGPAISFAKELTP
jgi:hypothetical protein